jgi:hypothetical protein
VTTCETGQAEATWPAPESIGGDEAVLEIRGSPRVCETLGGIRVPPTIKVIIRR